MPTTRLRPPPSAVLIALAAAAVTGCAARGGAAPATRPTPAAQTLAQPNAPPAAPTGPGTAAPSNARARPPAAGPFAAPPPAPGGTPSTPAAPTLEARADAPELTLDQMQRRSPSAALVETFNAACAEPARDAVARAAKRLEFMPFGAAARREASARAAAVPEDADAWRGPDEVGGAVLVWDPATSTCELRAEGVNLLLVESAFSRLPRTLEDEGASVMRLAPPAAPADGVRTRQVLLVQPGRFSSPERARVLRLAQRLPPGGAPAESPSDAVTLSARGVSAPR